ncbi:ras-related protein R-Ras-like, partial [Haliaeetus albicilla]|uniref:ras-related protein R-Ras-like n=1 Tax=Haliaeetus albicilla TaxID=8969 RepID=UPI0037E84166
PPKSAPSPPKPTPGPPKPAPSPPKPTPGPPKPAPAPPPNPAPSPPPVPPPSFGALRRLHAQILRVKDRDDVPAVMVGNKADLRPHRQVSREEAQAFARQNRLHYLEASAKTHLNVDEAFHELVRAVRRFREQEAPPAPPPPPPRQGPPPLPLRPSLTPPPQHQGTFLGGGVDMSIYV